MQPGPENQTTLHERSTSFMPAGVTAPAEVVASAPLPPPGQATAQRTVKKRHPVRTAVLSLLAAGLLLEILWAALYPLLASRPVHNGGQALPDLFPWLARPYWTNAFPALAQWLDLAHTGANIQCVILMLAVVVMFFAARVGNRVARERLSPAMSRLLFATILLLALLFGMTMVLAPLVASAMSSELLLSGLYGRMAVIYHVNPYVVAPVMLPHDQLERILAASDTSTVTATATASLYGPIWLDVSVLVALFAHNSLANLFISFRLLGLVTHLVNATLIWVILGKLRPEVRIASTLLYAWNPLVLVLGVALMHPVIILLLLVLLAIFFFQRGAFVFCWIFVLLAALFNPLYLLLPPLFLRLIVRNIRFRPAVHQFFWWARMVGISLLVVMLAYLPYWNKWGVSGFMAHLHEAFLPHSMLNSLDAAILTLPLSLPVMMQWMVMPQHWAMGALVLIGIFLLFSVWLVDTLALMLLCASWLSLFLLLLEPVYWPWYLIPPLALTLCSAHQRTQQFVMLLLFGALFSYYCWLWQPAWTGQALVAVGLPFLLWGWLQCFASIWHMTHNDEAEDKPVKRGISRPPWLSRPSWPSRAGRHS